MRRLRQVDARGDVRMVDISGKPVQAREAVARGEIRLQRTTLDLIRRHGMAKGDVLAAARLAGILAAKRTSELIPLCHPVPITHCEVNFTIAPTRDRLCIQAAAKTLAQTGVEMEALVAVSMAALTVYDMCKAVDKTMRISAIRLVRKTKRPVPCRPDGVPATD